MFSDILNLFYGVAAGPGQKIRREQVGNFVVSTVISADEGPETAILDVSGAHPVQRYSSVEHAEEGHVAWVQKVKDNPSGFSVTKLGYGSIIEDKEILLQPMPEGQAEEVAAR